VQIEKQQKMLWKNWAEMIVILIFIIKSIYYFFNLNLFYFKLLTILL